MIKTQTVAEEPDDSTVIHTLTGALRRERTNHRERVQQLEQRLAAAHGEILRLQRQLREQGVATSRCRRVSNVPTGRLGASMICNPG
ncbi:hypothetical protein [Streptomyces inhibens]|uniref:hypothetical protein n=1 Tax=Streptomyces inhibens TaxID=2293571 RepID=UPI001EE6F64B|nr:hypothetical protein [Streptomyces inhibens]UKY55592.1 hypothetical protein KI385_08200 [Streptomyces inhibens]